MLKLKLTKKRFVEVETIEAARREVEWFIDVNDLRASTYNDCALFDEDGRRLGTFSYNGRFWPEGEARR